jgi:hypothetical protein
MDVNDRTRIRINNKVGKNRINSFLHLVIRRLKVCFWKYRKQQTDMFNWNRENGYW